MNVHADFARCIRRGPRLTWWSGNRQRACSRAMRSPLRSRRNCALPARPSVCAVKASHLAPLVAKGFFEQCQKQRSMKPPRMKSCQRRCANNCAGIKDVEAVKRRGRGHYPGCQRGGHGHRPGQPRQMLHGRARSVGRVLPIPVWMLYFGGVSVLCRLGWFGLFLLSDCRGARCQGRQ